MNVWWTFVSLPHCVPQAPTQPTATAGSHCRASSRARARETEAADAFISLPGERQEQQQKADSSEEEEEEEEEEEASGCQREDGQGGALKNRQHSTATCGG